MSCTTKQGRSTKPIHNGSNNKMMNKEKQNHQLMQCIITDKQSNQHTCTMMKQVNRLLTHRQSVFIMECDKETPQPNTIPMRFLDPFNLYYPIHLSLISKENIHTYVRIYIYHLYPWIHQAFICELNRCNPLKRNQYTTCTASVVVNFSAS